MKKMFLVYFFSCLFFSLSAMTELESKKPNVVEALVSTPETNISLEAINARFAKIALNGKCFSLKHASPIDMEHSIIKTINIFHGDAKIGDIFYGVPKSGSLRITFWRQLYRFTHHGLGMILALVALDDDAFKISKYPNVFVTSTSKESVKSLNKFGFTINKSASSGEIVTLEQAQLVLLFFEDKST